VLLPVWGAGVALRVAPVARVGRGWWLLPFIAYERADHFVADLTRPRHSQSYALPPRPKSDTQEPPTSDWAKDLGQIVLWLLAIVGGSVLLMTGHDAVIQLWLVEPRGSRRRQQWYFSPPDVSASRGC
jgi:hypothetical protein